LWSVEGLDVRPALARMRTSLFQVLSPLMEGATVVDLFAGTGCLGIEALSRGAARAVFVENDRRCLEVIRMNLERLRFAGRAQVIEAGAFETASGLGPAQIAFVDPPYAYYVDRAGEMRRLVETLLASVVVSPEGRVVVERTPRAGLGEVAGGAVVDERRYGGTVVTLYARA
jgi:16S rRNA (guanine(966)-N(2))-methyltransferase RsmD